ncbi:hypothetical protein, partial [Mesorhizobium sp. M7A.F.Ca.CA.002.15.2.1]|uniref:hypothetical protein n=1 Tax=Mesorhizobium sp. M7A.F.Ca.CA.002.15.2.1 TaxID=2496678 RepID=UPI0019D0FABD
RSTDDGRSGFARRFALARPAIGPRLHTLKQDGCFPAAVLWRLPKRLSQVIGRGWLAGGFDSAADIELEGKSYQFVWVGAS